MKIRREAVTFQGTPLSLLGTPPPIGEAAPDFEVVDTSLSPVRLQAFKEKVRVLISVPSLDTPICDQEARHFEQEAVNLGEKVVLMAISMDLPFAQERWCGASHVRRLYTFSDHRHAEFAKNYGVLIKELRLCARAVFVVDQEGILRYAEYVREMTDQPDYAKVIAAIKELV